MATVCLLALTLALSASAQDSEPTYTILDCMKSSSPDYADIESQIWKPIHQEMVNQGKKLQWGLYWVLFGDRSECDYYTVNVVTQSQLDDSGNFAEAFEAVHPGKDADQLMAKTAASREMVWTELWLTHEFIAPENFAYAQINHFSVSNASDYLAIERDYAMPTHSAMVADGVSAGWGLYGLVSPSGEEVPYTHGTADFTTTLAGFPFWEYLEKVHEGKDLNELSDQLNAVRDVVSSETWMLVDRTMPAE